MVCRSATMLFPIKDDDRHLLHPAWVSLALLAANVLLFLYQLIDPAFTLGFSAVPVEITRGIDLVGDSHDVMGGELVTIPQTPGPNPIYLTLLSSMFMHGGWFHLGSNLLYLWIFGDNVEHRFGAGKFLAFYLLSGIAASFAQIAVDPDSIIPTLGASGAISGVLGAYMVLFPRNQVTCIFLFRLVSLPAVLVLGLWIVLQFLQGGGRIFSSDQAGGVAYAAHIGGFVAGILAGIIARLLLKSEPETPFSAMVRRHHPPPLPRR